MRHYVLEYFRDVWNVWLKAKTTKDCQVAVDDLIPGSRSEKRATALHCQFPDMEGVVVNVIGFHSACKMAFPTLLKHILAGTNSE